jgi:hypothetical protein
MLTLISHFSPFPALRDQAAANRCQFHTTRAVQGKKSDQRYGRPAIFADFAFFAIRRHISPLPSVPCSRIRAGIGCSVKGKRWRVATRPLTFTALLPAINACGRGTEMTPSGACSGNIPQRRSRERRRRNPVGIGRAFSVQFSLGIISKSQPTFRGHTLTRVPLHGWRVAPPLRTPEKAQRQKGGKP